MRAPKQPRLPAVMGPIPPHTRTLHECLRTMYRDLWRDISNGKTGTLIVDDGANWRVTLTFTDGRLTDVATAASTAATATWSE